MKSWMSVNEILEFAISEEENAAGFYTELAYMAGNRQMKDVFLEFADEERGHKARIQAVKDGKKFTAPEKEITDLKISDYVADVSTDKIENFEDALVVAMKKEKAAFKLYTRLAGMVDSKEAADLFLALAREEAKHKLRFEIEYDQSLKDN